MKNGRFLFCVWVFAVGVCSVAFCHDKEPLNTNFAAPFARGSGNLQVKLQYFHNLNSYEFSPVEFEYGFASRQQLSVGTAIVRSDDGNHLHFRPGNLEVAYRLLVAGDNRRKFAVSINPELELPTGDKRVSERSWTAGGTINVDTHPARRWWTHANVGYFTQVARIEEREKLVVYHSAVMFDAHAAFAPVLEVIGETDIASHVTKVAIAPEAILSLNHRWEIKIAIPLGVTSATPNVGVQLGVTWKFGGKGRQ